MIADNDVEEAQGDDDTAELCREAHTTPDTIIEYIPEGN
jgi:hypothetical protein